MGKERERGELMYKMLEVCTICYIWVRFQVQVIEEAVRYIEELHAALVERFRQKHGESLLSKSDLYTRKYHVFNLIKNK